MTVHYVVRHGKRIAVETIDTGINPKSRVAGSWQFVKVPLAWVNRLAEIHASGSVYRVAMYLLYQAWRTRRTAVKLTNAGLTSVSRPAKRAALCRLEAAGLIVVERRPDKSPIVTVLQAD
jgi:hypothetical protein